MSISVDRERFEGELGAAVDAAMQKIGKTVEAETRSRLRTEEGKRGFSLHGIRSGGRTIRLAVFYGDAYYAVDNYGTGSKMAGEKDNPKLAAYKRSRFWNPARKDNRILTRGGTYETIFGTRKSHVRPGRDVDEKYALPASLAFQQATQKAVLTKSDFEKAIRSSIREMDWSKVLVVRS